MFPLFYYLLSILSENRKKTYFFLKIWYTNFIVDNNNRKLRREIRIMKLKNILIVVKDIEKSKQFYHDLFGLDMVLDNDGNMILTEGLVLQDEKIWKKFLEKDIIPKSNSCELYFEEQDIESFIKNLEKLYPSVQYVNRLMTHSWGQKVIRFYDLDGNLIEVGTPMEKEPIKC